MSGSVETPDRMAAAVLPWQHFGRLACLELTEAAARDRFFPRLDEPLSLVMAPSVPSYSVLNQRESRLLHDLFEQRVDPDRISVADARTVARWKSLGFFSHRSDWPAWYPPTSVDQIRDVENFNLFVEVTERCNLNCVYCYKSPRGQRTLPTSLIRRIIDEHPRGDSHIIFSGGEFFLHRDCDAILESCANSGLAFCVQTNGTQLSAGRIERLQAIRSAPWNIEISLDSLVPESNGRMRVGSDSRELYGIIRSLSRAQLGEHVLIHAVLTSGNLDQVQPLFDYAVEHGLAGIIFSPITLRGSGRDAADLRIGLDVLGDLYEELQPYFAHVERPIFVDFHGLGYRSHVTLRPDTVGVPFLSCRFFCNKVGVGASGEVFFCSPTIDEPVFRIGHVGEQPLREIVNGRRRKELSVLGFRQVLEIPECAVCVWRNLCCGCIALTYDPREGKFASARRSEFCRYQEKAFIRDIARNYRSRKDSSPENCDGCKIACFAHNNTLA